MDPSSIQPKLIIVEMMGERYRLLPFTIRRELEILKPYKSREEWGKLMEALDADTLVFTLWNLLEDKSAFPQYLDLADKMSASPAEKVQVFAAIVAAMNDSMPEIQEAAAGIKKKLEALLGETVKGISPSVLPSNGEPSAASTSTISDGITKTSSS